MWEHPLRLVWLCIHAHRELYTRSLELNERHRLVLQMEFKRGGESALRNSGLNYTVVRPGPIISEPGGYKALVFDQVRSYSCGIFLRQD